MPHEIPHSSGLSPIRDARVLEVIQRLNSSRRHPAREAFDGPSRYDAHAFAEYGFSIHPDQGDLIYLLCRAMSAEAGRGFRDFDRHVGALFRRCNA